MNRYQRTDDSRAAVFVLLSAQIVVRLAWTWNEARTGPHPAGNVSVLGALEVVLAMAGTFSFLVWLLAVQRNLKPLGSVAAQTSPEWVVVGWFIPFYNLTHGYNQVRRVWIESGGSSRAPLVAGWWWTYWAGLALAIAFMGPKGAPQHPMGLYLPTLLDCTSAGLGILVVIGIDQRQEQRHRAG